MFFWQLVSLVTILGFVWEQIELRKSLQKQLTDHLFLNLLNTNNHLSTRFQNTTSILTIISDYIDNLKQMVNATFVLSVYAVKGDDEKRRVNYRQTNMRYLVVVVAILVVFGCEYCFDNASALQQPIQKNLAADGKPISESQFNLLYALYAFPNIIVPLLGGILIDKYGARVILIITSLFCLVGHTIFGMGGKYNSFGIMLFGRIVFGIGGQVLHSSQNTLISNWFKAGELSMILGICLSFPKMGSSLNSFVSPLIAQRLGPEEFWNVAGPIFVGAIIMSISLVLAIVLAYIDRKSEKSQKIKHESEILSQKKQPSQKNVVTKKSIQSLTHKEVKIVQASHISQNEPAAIEGEQHINIKEICKLPAAFWLIIVISMLSQALFIPFLDNGNSYYVKVFEVSTSEAGVYLILPYCISSLFVVIFGYLVEKIQKRSNVLIAACAFYTLTYIFMMFAQATASLRENNIVRWMPAILLGICIAIFCSIIVPTVPMLVPAKIIGTGFGIMEMLQNLALGVFPLISGFLRESAQSDKKGFHLQTLFFFVISCVCMGISFILKSIDATSGNKLDVKDFRKKYVKKLLSDTYGSVF